MRIGRRAVIVSLLLVLTAVCIRTYLTRSSVFELGATGIASALPAPTTYPLYSSYFKGASPFHATVPYLLSLPGTKTLPSAVTQALWSQGIYRSNISLGSPIFLSKSGDQAYSFSCQFYSSNGCNAQGKKVRIPANAYTQDAIDHHIIDVDTVGGYEIDGWGGGSNTSQYNCSIGGYVAGVVSCSWGGYFPFSGNGTDANSRSTAIAAGYAVGAIYLNAQDMLNGLSGTPIKHALGISIGCLDSPSVYPADANVGTDTSCDKESNGGVTQPAYGDLLVLKMTSAQIAATAYSPACKVILNALASYGAYTTDTEGLGNGIAIDTEGAEVYGASNNPWYSTIFPAFETNGNTDGSGSGSNFTWNSCLTRLSASDFDMIQIQNGAGQ